MLSLTYPNIFNVETRTAKLTTMGDPLVNLNTWINREVFRPDLARVHEKERKGYAEAKPIDAVLMVKILVLQHLQLLTDEGIEHQLRNQLSFMHFLNGNWKTRCDDSAYRSMEH